MSRLGRLLALIALLYVGDASAQAPYTVSVSVRPDSGVTETTALSFVIQVEGVGSPQVVPPNLVGLKNLSVLAGPSTNSSFVWKNGRSSSNFQLIYTLLPDQPGEAEIPAIAVSVDSKQYTTNAIRINVAKAAPGAPVPAPQQQRQRRSRDTLSEADVFIETDLRSAEAWVGQVIALDVTLYTLLSLSDFSWHSQPEFADFWVETLDVDPNLEKFGEVRNGRNYTAHPIERRLLVPLRAGEFELDPYVAQMQVHLSRSDPFDLFSRRRAQTVVRKTRPFELRVKALPRAKRPDGFGGAVGSYRLTVKLDRKQAKVNDAVALTATVRGEGSLRAVDAPILNLPAELKVFDPKVAESFEVRRGKMVSTKNWEWILVPLAPGEIRLPQIELPFFNPATGRYESAKAPELLLAVERGDGGSQLPTARGDIQLQRRDLAFVKPLRGTLSEDARRAHQGSLFLALLLLPVGLVPLFIAVGRHRDRLQRDLGLARGRRARNRARKRFHSLRKRVDQEDSATFHEELARALVEYVADKFNRAASGLTYDLADELLVSRDVDSEVRRRYRSCLESCDFARFVPAAAKVERRSELLAEAIEVVESLERSC